MMILNGSHSLQQEGAGAMIQAGRPGPLQVCNRCRESASAPWTQGSRSCLQFFSTLPIHGNTNRMHPNLLASLSHLPLQ
jgi:hypothetical protein